MFVHSLVVPMREAAFQWTRLGHCKPARVMFKRTLASDPHDVKGWVAFAMVRV